MTFLAIRNLLLILTSSATAATTSFLWKTTAPTLALDRLQEDKKIAVFMSIMTSEGDGYDGMNPSKDHNVIMQTSSLIDNEEEIHKESMEAVKFNDDDKQQQRQQPQSKRTTQSRKRGRPGIVVFSGGTAFNAAAAEMASRNVESVTASNASKKGEGGAVSELDDSTKSDNSINDMMTSMMMMDGPPLQSNTNQSNNIESGGIKVWHVLPVTDDGGSTAEIVRVLGGPAVGDIRSRLLRLAPGNTREGRAVRRLLGHRLISLESYKKQKRREKDGNDREEQITADEISRMAREEWFDIIDGGMEANRDVRHYHHINDDDDNDNEVDQENDEGSDDENYEHPLWRDVSAPYRSIIRAFLIHFHSQVMITHNGIRPTSKNPPFDFTGGSVGNFFFAGARTFFGSLPAAIFLFSKVANIPSGSRVLPAVLSEERLVLGGVLEDGTRLRGQYEISHPSPRQLALKSKSGNTKHGQRDRSGSFKAVVKSFDSSESFNEGITSLHPSAMSRVCYLLHDPTWRRKGSGKRNLNNPSIGVEPPSSPRLKSRVRTDWTDRHEIVPEPNPSVLEAISNTNCIVFGCGSLFTSVLPSLVLRGVGEAIVRKANVPRVLLLNGWHDHETTWLETSSDGSAAVKQMDATAIVQAVVNAFDRGGVLSGCYSESDFSIDGECKDDEDGSHDTRDVSLIPLISDYITHIFYPIGSEIVIDKESLDELCKTRQRLRSHQAASMGITEQQNGSSSHLARIKVVGIASIPANDCVEGKRSGGKSHHRIFDAGALVDALLELASESALK